MAITTVNHHLLLPTSIDMSTLSYSELHSLSLLSNSSLSLPSLSSITTTTTTATTTTTSFTSTALATPHHRHRHHTTSTTPEPDRTESLSIVHFLKRYLRHRNQTESENESVRGVEIVNRNGVVVDLAALEERDDPFGEELDRMFGRREKEEELLEILAGIDGNWCSKRKKRRVIDACFLGDALPVGWKVVIALRRKGGTFSPYCRRYISPTGEHLSSCKEISSYLKSYFGINDTELLRDSRGDLQQLQCLDLNNLPCLNSMDKTSLWDVSNATTSNTCLPIAAHEKDVSVSNVENLPDVQVSDHYECHACNISFDVKDNYMQHVLSSHERTTKRYRLGSSVGNKVAIRDGNYECHECNISFDVKDKYLEHLLLTHKTKPKKRRLSSSVIDGVIIRDGKYECQFCDKIFDERRRYIGHVGNHVKGSIKSTKGSLLQVSDAAKTPRLDSFPTEFDSLKRDALIEIAQNSIQDEPLSVPGKEPSCLNIIDNFCIARNGNVGNADIVPEKNSSFCVAELGVGNSGGIGKALSLQFNPCSNISRTKNSYPRETGKDIGKDKTLKLSLSPLNKDSEISVDIGDINGSLPCLTKNDMEKVSIEARDDFSMELLYSCDRMRGNTICNGTTNSPVPRHSDIEVEKDGREDKTSSNLKACNQVSVTFVADGETKKPSFQNNSASNWVVKSASTKDGGPPEGSEGLKVTFLSYNQKPSDMDSAAENIQSMCMEQEPELAQGHNDDGLATVTRDARTFGCAALLNSSSPFDEIFEKAGQNICSLDSNLESGNGFEYMKLDEIEPQMYKYNAMNEEDSIFLPEVSMDLENNTGFDLGFDASATSQSEFLEPIASRRTTMMTCVWCGSEFSHEVVEMDPQPDSVGFMCPDCRSKISKQFNELESNFSVNHHYS